jgi:hypothetical protein
MGTVRISGPRSDVYETSIRYGKHVECHGLLDTHKMTGSSSTTSNFSFFTNINVHIIHIYCISSNAGLTSIISHVDTVRYKGSALFYEMQQ